MKTKKFAEKLRHRRDYLDRTQGWLAKLIHTNQSQISKWESGETDPNLENLIKISRALGVTIDYLVDDSIPVGDFPDVREEWETWLIGVAHKLGQEMAENRILGKDAAATGAKPAPAPKDASKNLWPFGEERTPKVKGKPGEPGPYKKKGKSDKS